MCSIFCIYGEITLNAQLYGTVQSSQKFQTYPSPATVLLTATFWAAGLWASIAKTNTISLFSVTIYDNFGTAVIKSWTRFIVILLQSLKYTIRFSIFFFFCINKNMYFNMYLNNRSQSKETFIRISLFHLYIPLTL